WMGNVQSEGYNGKFVYLKELMYYVSINIKDNDQLIEHGEVRNAGYNLIVD
ncbi:1247_t:CDS:1, partial [Dentiscutata heterogama]